MSRYDLFKRTPDGSPYWIGTADNLPQARKMVEGFGDVSWGTSYFVRDAYDGETIYLSDPPRRERSAPSPPADP